MPLLDSEGSTGSNREAQTLRWLVRAAEQEAPRTEESGEEKAGDLRLVRSACSPKVLVPLVRSCTYRRGPSRVLPAPPSACLLRRGPRLEQVPDSLLSLSVGSVTAHVLARIIQYALLLHLLGTLKKFFADKGFGFITPDEPGQGDIFAPARNLVGSDESKCREGLRVTFESEIEARTNKPKATTWSILEGVIAAALPAAPGALAGLAGGYGAIPNGYVDLQRYSPYGVAGLQAAATMPAGYGAVQGAIPGMAMGGVTLSGGLPGTLQGALPAGYAVLPGTPGVLSAPTAVPALPPGWEQAVDPASGKVYYANRSTGETSWVPPAPAAAMPQMLVATAPAPGAAPGAVPGTALGAPATALASAPATALTSPAATAPALATDPATAPAAEAPAAEAVPAVDGATAPVDGASQAQPPAEAPALPAGWEQGVDAGSGKTYYYNRATNQSSWTIPTA
ncbi:pub1 [Symbiodinium natans]|uniref:Pub1 protein n=1 Tax=Symbiodinium natans TaxID=878477 RepID=A0A812UGS4_9DINO|nr:pub1 [Symbiodinium natans]